MSRVRLWVCVALLLGVALGAIPTFLIFHGTKSSPQSSQAIPVYVPSPVVPYPPRPDCLGNQLLNNGIAFRSRCERERLLRPDQPHPVLVRADG